MSRLEAFLETLREQGLFEKVYAHYLKLEGTGPQKKALCPFHDDRRPSFSVRIDEGLWYCFACGQGGTVITFVQKVAGLSFSEALQRVAELAGVPLPEAVEEEPSEKRRLLRLLEQACEYYRRALWKTQEGAVALQYLRERGFSTDLVEEFALGWAPEEGRRIIVHLREAGYTAEEMQAVGLATARAGFLVDRFRGRIIIPIHGPGNRCVGFAGRALKGQEPKYLNSPESEVFAKKKILFNYPRALPEIRRQQAAVLVEGYMDVLGLARIGIRNAVAGMGTALTPEQARLLARVTRRVYLAYDADPAGLEATRRAAEALMSVGVSPHVVPLPPGKDPDEVAREGVELWQQLMRQAREFAEFFVESVFQKYPLQEPWAAEKILEEVSAFLSAFPDETYWRKYAELLHARLGLPIGEILRRLRQRRALRESTSPSVPVRSWDPVAALAALALREPEILTESFWEDYFPLLPEEHPGRQVLQILASGRPASPEEALRLLQGHEELLSWALTVLHSSVYAAVRSADVSPLLSEVEIRAIRRGLPEALTAWLEGGEWSDRYRAWCERSFLRAQELLDAGPAGAPS